MVYFVFGGRTWRRTDLFDLILVGICFLDTFWFKILGRSSKIFLSLPSNGDDDPT